MLKRLTTKLLHLSMTWKSVLLLALITGAVTGLLAQADFLSHTSFAILRFRMSGGYFSPC